MSSRYLANELKRRMAAANLSQKRLALKAGLNETAVRDIITGRSRHPRHDTVEKLAGALDCSVAELIDAGAGPVAAGGDGFVMVATYDPRRDSGRVSVEADGKNFAPVAFQQDWLAELTRTPPAQLAVIAMKGDSMAPTLADGDMLLVDLSQWSPGEDGLYVARFGDSLLVKRLTLDPVRQRIVISTDNPAHPPLSPLAPSEIDLVGRVIWVGKRA